MNVNEIKNAVGGKFFRVRFIKKDGSVRTMVCRFGVKKYLKGTGRVMSPEAQRYIAVVWDVQKGAYRSFDLRRMIDLKCGEFEINVHQYA